MSGLCRKTRREFLWEAGAGFTGLAMTGMLSLDGFFPQEARAAATGAAPHANPLAPKKPHFPARTKSVIFLFMYGGPSQLDTFDYKPHLVGRDGQTVTVRSFREGNQPKPLKLMEPRWKFKPYGKSGKFVSDLYPHVGECVDDIAFVHSLYSDAPVHGSAMIQMNTGKILSGSPSLGAWVNYGLGTVNQDLPGYVVMTDTTGGPISGAKNWSSGYMPAAYQGTVLRSAGDPILDLARPEGMTKEMQREVLDSLGRLNEAHRQPRAANSQLAARIASYELAFQMQTHAPEAVDISKEPEHVKALYGMDKDETRDFGYRCLLARRLVERGVRFIQLYAGGGNTDFLNFWDAHGGLVANHNRNAGRTDKPIAGLLKDLKQRGLLDSTLVVWGGEFGRTSHGTGDGRDHNAYGYTMWLAGGGVKGGVSAGQTDELGMEAAVDRYHVKNLHATILHQMGIDPNRLSFFYGGLDQKLVGVVPVEPIRKIIS
uniref:DUF1501 domain-containing protein n=1 Tax=uncultured Armatimonadetes bacterium TaxID=157466 RepID=A0A6J4JFE7_9BACT|nr:hypothetical protein-putative related to sulfatases [uncultured Armatimonadetes bacterium]